MPPRQMQTQTRQHWQHPYLWADPQKFADANPPLTLAEATEAIHQASWVLQQLTNNSINSGGCWRDTIRVPPGACRIRLLNSPVRQIIRVSRRHDCGSPSQPVTEHVCLVTPRELQICCGRGRCWDTGCRCSDEHILVDYVQESNLPPGSGRMAEVLAEQYLKASSGKPCKIPERVTNVSRQGVSWTILDPQDFLDKGLVGIGEVDHWLAAMNRHLTRSWKVTDVFKGQTLWSEPIECRDGAGPDHGTHGGPFRGTNFGHGFDTP